MKTKCEKKLEMEKLNRLIDKTLKNGAPIFKTHTIMKQSNKVNHRKMRRIFLLVSRIKKGTG